MTRPSSAGSPLLEPTYPDDDIHDRRLRFLPEALIPKGRKGARRYDAIHFISESGPEIRQASRFRTCRDRRQRRQDPTALDDVA